MSSFSALKTAIQAAIKQNGNNEITGDILQEILLSIVSTLGDSAINNLETGLQNEVTTRGNDDAALSQAIENEATARGNQDTQLGNLITGIKNNIDNGYVYAGIATPSTIPVSGKVFYVAIQPGTYTNFGNTAVTQGINILKYYGSVWSKDVVIGIDDEPTAESNNLVKSGGVEKKLIIIEKETTGIDSISTKNINATGNYKFFDVNFPQGTQFKLSISGSAVWTRMWFAYNNNAGRLKDFVTNNNEYTITAPVDIISIEVYMYTMTTAGTVSLRLRTDSVIQKIFDTGVFKEIGKNLFNKDDSSIKTGYYLDNEGDEVSASTYSISPYIPFTEGYLVMSYGGTNAISGSGCLCCYNANKELVSSINITNSKGVIAWSTGVKYARFSYLNAYEEILQIEKGKYATPYTPYGQYVPEADIEPSAKIPTISSQRIKGTVNANGNIELPVLYCRYAQNLSAIITGTISGSGVEVGRGRNAYNGGSITITATEIVIGAEHYAHGLTLTSKTFVMLTTDNSLQGKVVIMTSAGDKFEQEVSTSMGGAAYVKNNTGSAIDVELSFEPRRVNSPIWLIGDSYMSYATTRWPYYLIHDWGLNNFLIDNLPGGDSADMWASLWNLLNLGNPKYLVWALGMNGGEDENGAVNADWLSYAERLIFYCNERGIKPIFATIPSVPNLPHEKLNNWVRSSGYRYIDFAKAVNAQPDGTWDAGLLSNDNVHPTEAGAKVLASRVLIDFPEISIK